MTEPQIPQKAPYVIEVEPGSFAWCSCGLSANQPYCDGAHRTTDLRPVVVKVEEKQTVAWCGCKHTQTPPYCDGSHARLS